MALEESLQQLLEHSAGQQALQELQSPSVTDLLNNLQNAADPQAKLAAWQAILPVLLKAYYVARDNTTKFEQVRDMVSQLKLVAVSIVESYNSGAIAADQKFAYDVTQLLFRVANFYGMSDEPKICANWLNTAQEFIVANDLKDHMVHAVLWNLIGGEASRRYVLRNEDGTINTYPELAVEAFENAVNWHKDHGSTLSGSSELSKHMRHVVMCLGSVKVQRLHYLFASKENPSATDMAELKEAGQRIIDMMDSIIACDGIDDYRIAGALNIQAQAYLLQGELSKAIAAVDKAAATMPVQNAGQLSNILNDAANVHLTMAFALFLAIANHPKAKKEIKDVADFEMFYYGAHPAVAATKKLVTAVPLAIHETDPNHLYDLAETFFSKAGYLYQKSYHLSSDPNKPEHIYAEHADTALKQLRLMVLPKDQFELLEKFYLEAEKPEITLVVKPKTAADVELEAEMQTAQAELEEELEDFEESEDLEDLESLDAALSNPLSKMDLKYPKYDILEPEEEEPEAPSLMTQFYNSFVNTTNAIRDFGAQAANIVMYKLNVNDTPGSGPRPGPMQKFKP